MHLSDTQIDRLINQKAISEVWPWNTNDETQVDDNLRDIIAELRRKLRLADKTEFGHYGSGYASFVDCWLYRPDKEFRYEAGNNYFGLVVLFSRMSPYYVLGQGRKSWKESSGASYLPHFEFVDELDHPSVVALVPRVDKVLVSRGLERLHKADVEKTLPIGTHVPTVLAEKRFRYFDALFYWED